MSRNEKAVLCFGIVLMPLSLAAQQDGEPRFVRPQIAALFMECRPGRVCRSDLAGLAKDFTLRWSSRREGHDNFLVMEMEGRTFEVPIWPDFITGAPFPLLLETFSDDLVLYAVESNVGSGGVWVNYFTRDDDGAFHYQGLCPGFVYDKSRESFVGSIRWLPGDRTIYYYKLKGHSLVHETSESSLVLEGIIDADTWDETRGYPHCGDSRNQPHKRD